MTIPAPYWPFPVTTANLTRIDLAAVHRAPEDFAVWWDDDGVPFCEAYARDDAGVLVFVGASLEDAVHSPVFPRVM